MSKFIVEGGNKLAGEVKLGGAKNSGFKLMIAALYANEKSQINNFSEIGDVLVTAQIINELGGNVTFGKNHELWVDGTDLSDFELSKKNGRVSRASTYFVGPLISRFGKAEIPIPGGCPIGQRPLDWHLEGFKALGANVENKGSNYLITADKLHGTRYVFPKNSHGGTDVMIIASVLAEGETILENAACEPEVDDLISFLNKMGAKIKRIEQRTIKIEGVEKLSGTDYRVMPDRNEAVTFGIAAFLTKGDILVKGADKENLKAFLEKVEEAGGGFEFKKEGIRFFYKRGLKSTNIQTSHYPGFMTDWQALWAVLMTQAEGTSIIHETVFEKRFQYLSALSKMGAKVELFNPELTDADNVYNFDLEDDQPDNFHAVKIFGSTPLKGTNLEVTDVRAGATITLAALCASGKSEITGIEHIERGYENLEERLERLGAKITRVE
ncbi:MAG: UDP-N-acetylglucosamine 1-carboxyvinyltransferase [bacterium]|nr:UDP-N-acetylglucosamine 1-carboxyvinyltransferase [bacterium]